MGAARQKVDRVDVLLGCFASLAVLVIAFVMGYTSHLAWLEVTSGDAQYTVTITSVHGLDAAALLEQQRSDLEVALSPALGIAVRIDNTRGKAYGRCLGGGVPSSAVVSYSNAVLGRGSVPDFCAEALGVGEATATAWVMDAQVPRFLRTRLAGELESGEAVLDVAVRTPGGGRVHGTFVHRRMDRLLVCKAKVGGGPSPPCLVADVDPLSTAMDSFER